jgi:hypothetical protein
MSRILDIFFFIEYPTKNQPNPPIPISLVSGEIRLGGIIKSALSRV